MKHKVKVKIPHIKSYASYIQLRRQLQSEQLKQWLIFREIFLNHEINKHGSLICVYCKNDNLKKEINISNNKKIYKKELRELATIDHIIPISKGGDEFNYKNLVISCHPCNQRKSDKN